MRNNDTFSFLPQDTIDPAIQNLGRTMGAINQQKIGQQEALRNQFNSLIDVSYKNMLANHQKEIVTDLDKFRKSAIQVFSKASDAGTPINMNEWAKVKQEHDELVAKATYAQQYKKDYYDTIQRMAVLDQKNELDPQSKIDLDNLKNSNVPLYDLPVPSSLIRTQYSPMQIQSIEKGMFNETTLLKKYEKPLPGGRTETHQYFDPKNVAKEAVDRVKVDPDFARFVQKNYGTLQNYVTAKQGIYNKEYQGLRNPPGLGSAAQTVPLIPYQKNGSEYVDVSSEGKTWSGTVTYNGKPVTIDNADILEASKDGKVVVNAKVPNPDYDNTRDLEYEPYDPVKDEKFILKPVEVDDHGNLKNILKKSKKLPATWSMGNAGGTGTPKATVPSGTNAQWKASGWSDAQIKEGVSKGIIKVL